MPTESIQEAVVASSDNFFPKNMEEAQDEAITPKQKDLLTSLIVQRIASRTERERWFSEIEGGLSKYDAPELISSFLVSASR